MAYKRLQNEYTNLLKDPLPMSKVCPQDNLIWKAYTIGPKGTPYEGGTFELEIAFPEDYPKKSPIVKFKTPIYHMNILTSGDICLSLWSNWLPTYSVSTVLLAISALLGEPNPNSIFNSAAGAVFKRSEKEYNDIAREWTKKHALQ